jgi:ribosomal protein S18 acetylase RimI-like enzyme
VVVATPRASESARVRPARQGDLRSVAALWAEAEQMHAVWHPGYFRNAGRLDDRVLRLLEDSDGHRELLVCAQRNQVIGFVHVELLDAKRGSGLGRRGHIDTLVVAPGWRRLGCGRSLVQAAAEWSKLHGASELLLTVWAGNEDAERFYEKIGLQPVSRVMKLRLESSSR